jgi:hypothetical protein
VAPFKRWMPATWVVCVGAGGVDCWDHMHALVHLRRLMTRTDPGCMPSLGLVWCAEPNPAAVAAPRPPPQKNPDLLPAWWPVPHAGHTGPHTRPGQGAGGEAGNVCMQPHPLHMSKQSLCHVTCIDAYTTHACTCFTHARTHAPTRTHLHPHIRTHTRHSACARVFACSLTVTAAAAARCLTRAPCVTCCGVTLMTGAAGASAHEAQATPLDRCGGGGASCVCEGEGGGRTLQALRVQVGCVVVVLGCVCISQW